MSWKKKESWENAKLLLCWKVKVHKQPPLYYFNENVFAPFLKSLRIKLY